MLSDAEAGMLVRKAIKVSGEVRCPVCGQSIVERFTVCPSCETPHHPDCWSYNQRCATYGCQPAEALQVVVPKEEAEVLMRELALYRRGRGRGHGESDHERDQEERELLSHDLRIREGLARHVPVLELVDSRQAIGGEPQPRWGPKPSSC